MSSFVVGFNPSFHSGSKIYSDGPVPAAIHMRLWSTTGFLQMFVTNIRIGMFVQTSCLPRAWSICCVICTTCICSIVIRSHMDVMKTISDSVSAGIVIRFADRIFVCSSCSSIGASCEIVVVMLTSVPLPSRAMGVECSSTILHCMGNMPRMHLSIKVILCKKLTVMFWKVPIQNRAGRSPIWRKSEIKQCILITSFVIVLKLRH